MGNVIKEPGAEASYGYHVGVWHVDADGDLNESVISLTSTPQPPLDKALTSNEQQHLKSIALFNQAIAPDDYERLKNLAFVRFYAKAFVRIRHEAITRPEVETLNGDLKEIFEEQFVVNEVAGSPLLKPKSEIMTSGQLSPYLAEWLGRVADHGAPYHWNALRTLEDFEPLLGKPLTPKAPLVTHDLP